ncbi:morphogenetic protein [Pantoea eucalypti]|uniref:morphogenetic protein n=1 Tax=Pantoea eucalypti TaxID=470933 RepID=UPI00289B4D21|nr:morphogenetic protein [Pantoea eucalypti]
MRERPIIFNADMVRAVLDGRKTQTRRAVKFPLRDKNFGCELSGGELAGEVSAGNYRNCPFGAVGDRLWVRETFGFEIRSVDGSPHEQLVYRASKPDAVRLYDCNGKPQPMKWTPSLHMRRKYSRITLEITGIRVERLQDISEQDAAAEGAATELSLIGDKHYLGYRSLCKSIYGDNSWQANPWVWVIEFKPAAGQTKGSSISSTSSEP